jgi:hypothetical protein
MISISAIEGEWRICIAHPEGREIHESQHLADLGAFSPLRRLAIVFQ